jgi:hypothetical protein
MDPAIGRLYINDRFVVGSRVISSHPILVDLDN